MRTTNLRRALILSTALNGVLLVAGAPVAAQTPTPTPQPAMVGPGEVLPSSTGIDTPAPIPTGSTQFDIDVKTNGAVVNWSRFDVPKDNTVAFFDKSGTNGASSNAPIAVLNRVLGDSNGIAASVVNGTIDAPANMAVYLVNTAGLTFGKGSVVNVGALIASTIDLSGSLDPTGASNRFTRPDNTATGRVITVSPGATIITDGTKVSGGTALGNLVLLGASVQMPTPGDGETRASLRASGDVGLVAAHDVIVTTSAGSPLSMVVVKGTRVDGAFSVDGTIAGQNVTLALATQGTVTDQLLSVKGMVTAEAASAGANGIVLSAGAPSGTAANAALQYATGVPVADIQRSNPVTSNATLMSARGVQVAAGGVATITGNVAALAGDYVVGASAVTLGSAGTLVSQRASGAIGVTATGAIGGAGDLRLTSNSGNGFDPASDRGIRLEGGSIALGTASLATASDSATAFPYSVRIDSPGSVALGRVRAFGLDSQGQLKGTRLDVTGNLAIGSAALDEGTFNATGDMSIGQLTTRGDMALSTSGSGSITTGFLSPDVGTLTSTAGTVTINAAGDASVAGHVDAFGTYSVTGNSVTTGGAGGADTMVTQRSRGGAITITARDGTIGDAGGSEYVTLQTDAAQPLTITTAGSSTTGEISLGNTTISAAGAVDVTSAATATAVTLGAVTAAGALSIDSAGGDLTTGTLSGASVVLSAPGDITATGVAATGPGAGGTVSVTGTGTLAVTGAITATGLLTIDRAGTLSAQSLSGTGGIAIGQNVRGGALTIDRTISTGAGSTLAISSNGAQTYGQPITAGGAVALDSNAAVQLDTLNAAGRVQLRGDGIRATAVTQTQGGVLTIAGRGSGAVALGALSSNDGITVSGPGAVSVRGDVTALKDYAVTGGNVTLGGTPGTIQTAQQAVTITANTGDVRAQGGMLLRADDRGTGAGVLTLRTLAAGARTIDTVAATLAGGTARRSEVRILSADAAGVVRLGNVNALALQGDRAGGGFADTITRSGTIGLGTLTLERGLVARSTGAALTTNGVRIEAAGAGLTLNAATTISGTGSVVSADGATVLNAGGAISLDGIASRSATLDVTTGSAALTAATVSAGTALTIATGAGAAAIDTISGGDVTVTAATLSGRGGSRAALTAGGAATLTLGDGLLGNVQAGSLTASATTMDVEAATTTGGALSLTTTGLLTAGSLSAANGLTVDAANAVIDSANGGAGDVVIRTASLAGRAAGARSDVTAGGAVTLALTTGLLGTVSGATVDAVAATLDAASMRATTGGVTVTAANTLTAGLLSGASGLTVNAGSARIDTADGGGGNVDLTADALAGRGAGARTDVSAGNDVRMVLSSGVLGSVSGATVDARATTLDASAVMSTVGTVSVTTTGALTAGSLSAANGLTVDAAAASIDTASGGAGDALIRAALLAGRATGARSDVGADGAVTLTLGTGALGTVQGASVDATAATLDVAQAIATGGAVALTAGGAVTLGAARASDAVTVQAGGAARVNGTIDAGGDYRVSGAGVTLGDGATAVLQRADGAIAITSADGDIVGANGVTLRANADGLGGEALSLTTAGSSAGAIALAGPVQAGPTRDAGSTLVVRSRDAANSVALGDVVAAQLLGAVGAAAPVTGIVRGGAVSVGAVDLVGALLLDSAAGVRTGVVTASGITLRSGAGTQATALTARTGAVTLSGAGGAQVTGAVEAQGDVAVEQGGAVSLGSVTAQNVAIGASGVQPTTVAVGGGVTARGLLTVRSGAGQSYAGDVAAGGAAILAGSALTLRDVTGAADVTLTAASGDLRSGTVRAGGAATLDAGAALVLTQVASTTGAVTAQGAAVTLESAASRDAAVALAARSGALSVGQASAGTDIVLAASGDLSINRATAARDLRVSDAAALSGPGTGARADLTAGRDLALSVRGAVSAAGLTAGRDVSATVGTLDATRVAAGGALTLDSAGLLIADALNAGGALVARGTGVTLGTVTGSALTLESIGGDLSLDQAVVVGDAAITAGGVAALGTVTAGGALTVDSGSATLTTARATSLDAVVRSGSLAIDDAATSGGLRLRASDDVQARVLIAGGALTVDAGGAAQLATLDAATLAINADTVGLGTGTATGDIAVQATGDLAATTIVSRTGSLRVDAGGSAALASITTAGAIDVSGGAVTLGTVQAAALGATATTGGLSVDDATIAGDTALNGAADVAVRKLASSAGGLAVNAADAVSLVSVTTAGATDVSGETVTLGTVRAGSIDAEARSGALSADDVATGGAMALAATSDVTARLLDAGTTLSVRGGGAVQVASATAAGAASIAGRGVAVTSLRGGSLSVTAGADTMSLSDALAVGDIALTGGGAIDVGQVTSSGGALTIDATGAVTATTLGAAGSLTAGGATLSIGSARAAGIAVTARAGALSLDDAAASGDVSVTQRGAGGLIVAGGLSAGGDAVLDADAAIVAPSLNAGSALRVTTGGAVTLGAVSAGGAADVQAAGAAQVTGAVSAQSYRVQGAQVALGNGADAVLQQASGAAEIVATGGAVNGAGGLVLRADGDGDGAGDLTLRANGAVTFADGSQVLAGDAGTSALRVTPGVGAALSLATVRAARLVSAQPGATGFVHDGAVSIAELTLRDASTVTLNGPATPLTLGTVASGDALSLTATGLVSIGRAQVAGSLDMRGGSVLATRLAANAATVSADGTLTVGTLTTRGATTLGAGAALKVTTLASGGNAAVNAGGALTLGEMTAGGAASVMGAGTIAVERMAVTNTLTLGGGADVTLGTVSVESAAMTAGGALDVAMLDTAGDAGLRAGSGLQVANADVGGAATMVGGGAVTVDRMAVVGALSVEGGTAVTLGDVSAGAATIAAGDTIGVKALRTLGDVGLQAGSSLRVGSATVGGSATVAGASVMFDRAAITDTLGIEAAGDVALGTIAARDLAVRTSGGLRLDDATIGGAATVAGGTIVAIARGAVAGMLTVDAGVDATLGTVLARELAITAGGTVEAATLRIGGDARARAGGALAIGDSDIDGDATVAADGTVSVGTLTARSASVTAGGSLDVATLRTAGDTGMRAGGALRLGDAVIGGAATETGAGPAVLDRLAVGGDATLTAGGALSLRDATVGGSVSATAGQDVTVGRLAATGALAVDAGGAVAIDTVSAAGLGVRAGGAVTFGTVTARGDARVAAGGALSGETWAAAGASDVRGQGVVIGAVRTQGALAVAGNGGAVRLGTAEAGGSATIAGDAGVTLGSLTAGGDVTAQGGSVAIETLNAGGAAGVTAGAGDLSLGTIGAGSARLRAAGVAKIAGSVSISGTQDVQAGAIVLGGDGNVAQQAGGIVLTATQGSVATRGALALAAGSGGMTIAAEGSGGAVDLTPATALASGGALSITTNGAARLGSVSNPARTVTIRAGDVVLTAPVTAGEVAIAGYDPARGARLGDAPDDHASEYGAAALRLNLSGAELGLIDAARVSVDAGQGAVTLGDVALKAATGATQFAVRTRGRVDVLGRLVADGSPATRTIVLGGGSDESTRATQVRVASTSAGGGRLLVGDATLELRGDAIGIGLDDGFLSELGLTPGATPIAAGTAASTYVAQSTSALYNAARFGAQGIYADRTTVRAGRLIARYGGFALFQNTGLSGLTDGVVLGSATPSQSAANGTLQLYAAAPANTVALFGTIDGIGGTATSLLGTDTLVVGDGVARADSRANGCLIGAAGGGCLSASLAQPVLNVFDSSRIDVFRAGDDLTLPFDPLISTSNEALFSDIADTAVGPDGRLDGGLTSPEEACRTERAACTPAGRP